MDVAQILQGLSCMVCYPISPDFVAFGLFIDDYAKDGGHEEV